MTGLLAWFFHGIDLAAVTSTLMKARPGLVVLAVVLALLSYWIRAVRWQFILRGVGTVSHREVVLATGVGFAAMALLPARAGDVVRPVLLARRTTLPVSACLASVLTERIFDLGTVVAFFLLFLLFPPSGLFAAQPQLDLQTLKLVGVVAGVGVLVGAVGLLSLIRLQDRFVSSVSRRVGALAPRLEQPIERFLTHFLDGLRVLQRPRDLLLTISGSLVLWFGIYLQLQVSLVAFGIDLPFRVTFFLVAGSIVGLVVPTPAGVGGFHKAVELSLGLVMTAGSEQVIKGFAIAHHAICFVPITIVGLAFIPLLGVTFAQLGSMARAPAASHESP